MRNYIYIWNEPKENYFIISGIEFKDFKNFIDNDRGYILLDHQSENTKEDENSRFEYITGNEINKTIKENIYSWGNFSWVDFKGTQIPAMTDLEISELLFFKHMIKPLNRPTIDCLSNQFLAYAHDDGWFLKLYYDKWENVTKIIDYIKKHFSCEINYNELKDGQYALWIKKGIAEKEEKTLKIDLILNRRNRPTIA